MSQIILLNGCGSSGKTSLAQAIQHESKTLWLSFGVDTFFDMAPYGKLENYIKFVPGSNANGPTMHVESRPESSKLFGVMPKFAQMLAENGNHLIIDEVLLDYSSLNAYVQSLKNHTVYYVGVFCELKTMQEREILRRDRSIGLSNDQISKVHNGLLNSYDFEVDTTVVSPFQAARSVLNFLNDNPEPKAFQNLKSHE